MTSVSTEIFRSALLMECGQSYEESSLVLLNCLMKRGVFHKKEIDPLTLKFYIRACALQNSECRTVEGIAREIIDEMITSSIQDEHPENSALEKRVQSI